MGIQAKRADGGKMTELLLTDIEIRDAMNKPFPSNESPWSLVDVSKSDKEIAKAQATKAVTGVFERIVVFDWTTLDSLKAKLLDDIKEGK